AVGPAIDPYVLISLPSLPNCAAPIPCRLCPCALPCVAMRCHAMYAVRSLGSQQPPLTGSIPSAIATLATLTYIDLSTNNLTGPLPTAIDSLSDLQFLQLRQNNFSGEIPPAIGSLSKAHWPALVRIASITPHHLRLVQPPIFTLPFFSFHTRLSPPPLPPLLFRFLFPPQFLTFLSFRSPRSPFCLLPLLLLPGTSP
ncbi:unnamed protein product, partial [Closterium sp. Yama58-4]